VDYITNVGTGGNGGNASAAAAGGTGLVIIRYQV
jgi:hypothetical protein